MAIASVALAALASLAFWRLVRVLLGDRPAMLVPLAVYLFSCLNLGGFTWWSATMQNVPLQIGTAWVVADAVLYLRTRRRRYVVTAPLALVVTMLFSERAVMIPVLTLAVVALLLHVEGVLDPVREAWRRSRAFWVGIGLTLAAWALAYLVAVPREFYSSATVAQITDTVRYFLWSIIPGLAGGPWSWTDVEGGSSPVATPPYGLFAASVVLLVLLVLWTSWRRRGAPLLWTLAFGYVAANALLVALGRGAWFMSESWPRAYRLYPTEPVLWALVLALLFALPLRVPAAGGGRVRSLLRTVAVAADRGVRGSAVGRWGGRLLVATLTVLYLVGASVSTITHVEAWKGDRAEDYFTNVRASLARAGDAVVLDQSVPPDILWPLAAPLNQVAFLFSPIDDRPEFGDVTDQLRIFDDEGNLQPARVTNERTVLPGPLAGCGWGVRPGDTTRIDLSGPLVAWPWTAQLNYLAGADGVITVGLGPDGQPLRVPVEKGAGSVFVRFSGADGGDQLRVTSAADGPGICIDSGIVGLIEMK
jgi:hypothetical protein